MALLAVVSVICPQFSRPVWGLLAMEVPWLFFLVILVPVGFASRVNQTKPAASRAFHSCALPLFWEMTYVYNVGLLFQAVLQKFFHAWEFLPLVCGQEVGFNCFWQIQKRPLNYAGIFVVTERLTVDTCFPTAAFWLFSIMP